MDSQPTSTVEYHNRALLSRGVVVFGARVSRQAAFCIGRARLLTMALV